ncbi:MAG: phage tail fiber protein, partial [Rhizobiaceae bacterium]
MSKGATFTNDYLNLIYKATAIANVADNAATAPITAIHVSLHSADPGSAGNQTTSEVAYTGYVRVSVTRGAGWTVTANSVSPAATVAFAQCTAGAATAYYWMTGTASTG